MSFPPGTEMFQFPGFASCVLWIQSQDTWLASPSTSRTGEDNDETSGGLPHSEIRGSKPIPGSPLLIAGYHVLHRLLLPRHPPNALLALDPIQRRTGIMPAFCCPAYPSPTRHPRAAPGGGPTVTPPPAALVPTSAARGPCRPRPPRHPHPPRAIRAQPWSEVIQFPAPQPGKAM